MAEASDVIAALSEMQDDAHRLILLRFFKTGPGEYGEGDRFLGLRVPQTREVVKRFRLSVPLDQIAVLLQSPWHEVRLCGFLLLVEEMKAATPSKRIAPTEYADRREQIARFYLEYARRANTIGISWTSRPDISWAHGCCSLVPTELIPTAGYLTTLREVPTYGNSV